MLQEALSKVIILACLVHLSIEYDCRTWENQGYWRCNRGYYNWPSSWHYSSGWRTYQCWEYWNGNYWHCWDPDGNYAQYYQGSYNSVAVYVKCHWWCDQCNGYSTPGSNCQSCRNGVAYKWVSDTDRCSDHCPNEMTDSKGNNFRGEYQSSN